MKNKNKTVVLGFGAMGSALVKGWLQNRLLMAGQITALDIDQAKLKKTASPLKIKTSSDPKEALSSASVVLLAVKPQQMKALLTLVGNSISPKTLVISIAAGVSTDQIENALPQGCPVVRVMPNTPALVGAGMAAVAGGKRARKKDVLTALKLFAAVGKAVQVNEEQMDLVTAISGSGPAYFFRMVEIMTNRAVQGGLDTKTAQVLVAQTALGAARMMLETGKTPETLRIQVTSPGGTTQAALETMSEKGFEDIMESAINSAIRRGGELRRMTEA